MRSKLFIGWLNWSLNSTDGLTWSRASLPVGQAVLNRIAYGNGMFVATDLFDPVALFASTNRWFRVEMDGPIYGIAYEAGTFIAAGQGAVYSSTNAVTWNRRNMGIPAKLHDAAFGNGRMAVVGAKGKILTSGFFGDQGPVLTLPKIADGRFEVQVPTVLGKRYHLEAKESITDPNWSSVTANAGDGSTQSISDPVARGPRRFYRIRAE